MALVSPKSSAVWTGTSASQAELPGALHGSSIPVFFLTLTQVFVTGSGGAPADLILMA